MNISLITLFLSIFLSKSAASDSPDFLNEIYLAESFNNFNRFSAEFSEAVLKGAPNNQICSSAGIFMLLMIAGCCGGGRTALEIDNGLHFNPNRFMIWKEVSQYFIEQLQRLMNEEFKYDLMYIPADLNVKPCLKIVNYKNHFRQRVLSITQSSLFDEWRNITKINHLIRDFESGDYNNNTRLVVLNLSCIYGSWIFRFEKIQKENFYADDGSSIAVSMMKYSGFLSYGVLPEASAHFVEMPCQILRNPISGISESFPVASVMVILPYGSTSNVDSIDLKKITLDRLYRGNTTKVDLSIPKLKTHMKINLKSALNQLGFIEMFEEQANFPGITDEESLKVGHTLQSTNIEFDENFLQVTTATELEMTKEVRQYASRVQVEDSPPPLNINKDSNSNDSVIFNVNRPFYLFIARENFILFSAKINHPNLHFYD